MVHVKLNKNQIKRKMKEEKTAQNQQLELVNLNQMEERKDLVEQKDKKDSLRKAKLN